MTFNTHVCIIISSIPSNIIDYVRINEKKKTMRFNTSLLHAGVTKETNGSTLPPVYQTSAFRELLVNVPENDTKWQGYNRFMETNFRRTSV